MHSIAVFIKIQLETKGELELSMRNRVSLRILKHVEPQNWAFASTFWATESNFKWISTQNLAARIIFQQNSTYSSKNVQLKELLNHDENLVMELSKFVDRFLGISLNFDNQPKA